MHSGLPRTCWQPVGQAAAGPSAARERLSIPSEAVGVVSAAEDDLIQFVGAVCQPNTRWSWCKIQSFKRQLPLELLGARGQAPNRTPCEDALITLKLRQDQPMFGHHRPSWYLLSAHTSLESTVTRLERRVSRLPPFWGGPQRARRGPWRARIRSACPGTLQRRSQRLHVL